MRVGFADVLASAAWPEEETAPDKWIAAIAAGGNDLEAPALKVAAIVGDVLAALRAAPGAALARMSGSGATCFAIFMTAAEARQAAQIIQAAHSGWWVHAGTLG